MTEKATTTTPDPELSTPLGTDKANAPDAEAKPGPDNMVPAAGKSAARPSEAEHIQALHEDREKIGTARQPDPPRDGGLSGIA